jgi:hypothetical protein
MDAEEIFSLCFSGMDFVSLSNICSYRVSNAETEMAMVITLARLWVHLVHLDTWETMNLVLCDK